MIWSRQQIIAKVNTMLHVTQLSLHFHFAVETQDHLVLQLS